MLGRLGFDSAALDAKLLTGYGLGLNSLAMATRENETVDAAAATRVAELLQRRMTGESVARIIGEREFYGLAFDLNAATLEPRPETELLVDLALDGLADGASVLDLGTGTGCIAISILANKTSATAIATDLSEAALAAASRNGARHGVLPRLQLRQGSWFAALSDDQRFDLIVSNPPYIATDVLDTLAVDVRSFDPELALDGGPDGLAPYRIIVADAANWLRPAGRLLVEIGYDQGAAVSDLLAKAGFVDVVVHKDLNGLDRVVSAHQI